VIDLATSIQQIVDEVELWPTRVFNVVSCIVVWLLALFVYHFRSNPKNFQFRQWLRDDRTRFIAGGVVTVALTILKATSPTVDEILRLLGFQVTQSSGVAYGLAIAAFLLGLKPIDGKKEQLQGGNN
jgi:hypothetical protein